MTLADRRSAADGHILIGGTGRAGTTLLVQWFTVLGFDTGFSVSEALTRADPISHGGLEHSLGRTLGAGARLPYVAKSPWLGPKLGGYLDDGQLRVRAAIVPLRNLHDAAESRRQVSSRAEEAGHNPERHPGGVVGAGRAGTRAAAKRQERLLARRFYELVQTLVSYDVPIYFLRFPEFARGQQDPFLALKPLLESHGVTHDEAQQAMVKVLRPELIHDFSSDHRDRPASSPKHPS
jgi:hypothetical protein